MAATCSTKCSLPVWQVAWHKPEAAMGLSQKGNSIAMPRRLCSSRQHHGMRMFPQLPGWSSCGKWNCSSDTHGTFNCRPLLHQLCLVLPVVVHCVAKGQSKIGWAGQRANISLASYQSKEFVLSFSFSMHLPNRVPIRSA